MSLLSFLLLLLIAALAGAVGQAFAGYDVGGCLVSTAVGFVGAIIGMWIARGLGIPAFFVADVGGVEFPVVWSIIGAALLVAVLGLLRGGSRRSV